jgi:hypothetical protein
MMSKPKKSEEEEVYYYFLYLAYSFQVYAILHGEPDSSVTILSGYGLDDSAVGV